MGLIEHYVCPQCGCADMRHTTKIEKLLYQAEERGIQEGLDLRDDLREQLAGAVEALLVAHDALDDVVRTGGGWTPREALTKVKAALTAAGGRS